MNGVDNGRLGFTNVRVPRTNLLNRYSDVSERGEFTSTISKRRDRFLSVADRLLSGRLCIASMLNSSTRLSYVITIRYGNTRLAVGEKGLSDTPIADFNLFQNAIYPLLARSIVLSFALTVIRTNFAESLLKAQE